MAEGDVVPDDIYWNDALAWSEQQAALLQRLANGERVNAAIDWEHVVEEVRDVGLSELRAVESLLTRGIEHLMKMRGWPTAVPVPHWEIEALRFLMDAQRACSPSMCNRIDLAADYRRALRLVNRLRIGGTAPLALPPICPFPLEALLPPGEAEPDIQSLVTQLGD
jgi:hypothetical protein